MNNRHATCVVLGDRGVMIEGAPGSGKTTLAFALIERCLAFGHGAAFVADDQVLVCAVNGRLVAAAPPNIAGMAELHGLGIVGVDHAGHAVIDLVVTLTDGRAERMPPARTAPCCGVELPHLELPARSAEVAGRLILGQLRKHAPRPRNAAHVA
ncbi:HPr kinase/phosphorylase [Mesorhizobium xinjiangense]|uniref:HPr kinase/phosphorylase n=1 Tax=Mesorhizobium xinjiangense TaxID=2678685 RepID=UPI0018DB930A|nr:HPr kinase/phosphatase C-terminal domain-containing protein [Mesorhizobium xinjiangense]